MSDTDVKSPETSEEQDNSAKFKEIERGSLLMALFSRIDEETGSFMNTPYLLGGEGYYQDEMAKESVEHAFGQLNLPDLFEQFDFILNVAHYLPIKLREDLKILPNFYVVKSKFESVFGMYLILSPYSDLNVTALSRDLSDLIIDYTGTAVRTGLDQQGESKKSRLLDIGVHPELEEASGFLLRRIYYRLFLDRTLSGGPEKPTKAANLVSIMIQEATIFLGWIDLETNQTFARDDVPEGIDESRLKPAPPVMEVDNVWFVFPPSLRDEYADYHAPINIRYLFQASHLPVDLNLAYFRLDPNLFEQIMPLPTKSVFSYRTSDDVISLFSHHREFHDEGEGRVKIQIVTGISDSKMSGGEFMSEMAMRIVIRDIEDGFKKDLPLEKIFSRSMQLKSWLKTIEYDVTGETTPEGLLSWTDIELRDME